MTDDDHPRRKPGHIATLRQIHEQQRRIDALIQPLVEDAVADAGNDPEASFALIRQRVQEHVEVQQAILDLEVTRLLRERMIAAGWQPGDATEDPRESPDHDDDCRQAD